MLGGLLIAVVTAAPAALVVAQTNPDAPVSNTNDVTTQQTTLEERIAKRKAALTERLTAAKQSRISQRCVAAQGKIRSHEARVNGVATARQNAYGVVITKLTELVPKLQEKGVDVSALEAQISVLKEKISAFQADLTEYKQAIADLAALDCTADPEAFQASLEATRKLRVDLVTSSVEIKMHVQEVIKPILVSIRDSLQQQQTTTETPSDASETEAQ